MSIRDVVLGLEPSDTAIKQFNRDYPQCSVVKGRYVSPWTMDTEKSAIDVLDYMWNRRQNKLRLPGMKAKNSRKLLEPSGTAAKQLRVKGSL